MEKKRVWEEGFSQKLFFVGSVNFPPSKTSVSKRACQGNARRVDGVAVVSFTAYDDVSKRVGTLFFSFLPLLP